jgi:tetratricopeptide (TPR) repeat protein
MNFYNKYRKVFANFIVISGTLSILATAMLVSTVQAQTLEQVQKTTRKITVRIDGTFSGSGIILAKRGSTYYVVTAKHVVNNPDQYTVVTYDGIKYPVNATTIKKFTEVDLAVVTFVSDRDYPIATISKYLAPTYQRRSSYNETQNIFFGEEANQQQAVFVAGFPNPVLPNDPIDRYVFNPGRIIDTSGSTISDPSTRADGYRLIYSNLTSGGMSGGAVLDANGRVIGIHGRADGKKIIGNRVVDKPIDEAMKTFRTNFGSSLGIPITTFLTLMPNTGLQIDLKIENTPPSSISTSQLESWIPEQEADEKINPIFWINRGNQLWRLGNFSRSQEAFDQAISLNPSFSQAWYAKGFVAGFNRNFVEALKNCEKAIELDPKLYDAWRCKAGALYRSGNPQLLTEALKALEKAIEINKQSRIQSLGKWRENPTDYTERGEILFAQGKRNEAIASFDKAIEIDPEMASAWSNRAFVQISIQDFTSAESSIDRSLAIDPNFAPAWANRGLLLFNKKRYTESVAAFDKAVELNDSDPEIWFNRGIALYESGQKEQGIQSIRKAHKIDSNYAPARDFLK